MKKILAALYLGGFALWVMSSIYPEVSDRCMIEHGLMHMDFLYLIVYDIRCAAGMAIRPLRGLSPACANVFEKILVLKINSNKGLMRLISSHGLMRI
ncbi:hypothetical protein ACWKW6_30045 [Dyadobacter jiangsuensis]